MQHLIKIHAAVNLQFRRYLEQQFSTWRRDRQRGCEPFLQGLGIDIFMYSCIIFDFFKLHLNVVGLQWVAILGYSGLLYWVAVQKRLKTTD